MDGRLEELLRMLRDAQGGGGHGGHDSDSDGSENSSSASGGSSSASSSSSYHQRCTKTFSELKRQLDIFLEAPERPFRPGDIVVWKEGCSNRKRPKADEPCVVIEVLPEPLFSEEKSAGTPYFHEPLDIVLGMLDNDGDLVRYCFDKRRFRLAVQPDDLAGQSASNKLRDLALEFNKPLPFHVGDVVMLKPGLRHRRSPDYNTVAVVLEIFDKPFRDTKAEEGTSSFYELISGRIGLLDSDGDLSILCVDLRRFRKVK